MEKNKEMSGFGFAYKKKTTTVDKRALRLHRRSIEWKNNRNERLNSARNIDSLSPLQELSSNSTVNQSYDGKTPSKTKTDNDEQKTLKNENVSATDSIKSNQQKMMRDRLAKWKAEKEMKRKLAANANAKPFKVSHVDHKELEKIDNRIKATKNATVTKPQTHKQTAPTKTFKAPVSSSVSKPSTFSGPRQVVSKPDNKTSVISKQTTRSTAKTQTRPSTKTQSSTSKSKPSHQPSRDKGAPTRTQTRATSNKQSGKEKPSLKVDLQKVSTSRGESFAPEEFTFTAPSNLSSFVFKPLSPNAAASFLNPSQDAGTSFIGTDPKRCSTPKSSDSVKKEIQNMFSQDNEQTFKADDTSKPTEGDEQTRPRRSTRQSRQKKSPCPDSQPRTRSSMRSQERSARRLSGGRRTLDRSSSRRLSSGGHDSSVRRTRSSSVKTPQTGSSRVPSVKRTREKDHSDEEHSAKRSKSVHVEPVNKPVLNIQEEPSTPKRRSVRLARKSLSQLPSKEAGVTDFEDDVFDNVPKNTLTENEAKDTAVDNESKDSTPENNVASEDVHMTNEETNPIKQTNVSHPQIEQVNTDEICTTPKQKRKSVRRSLHSKPEISNTESDIHSSPQYIDTDDKENDNDASHQAKKLTRSTKRRSFSSVEFAKPSADCTVLSAKRNATKKKRRKTVYDHTVVKSPEEWIKLLKDSPMVEMNRRTPKVKTPPPPALDFDLTVEELEQYSPTKTLNFSICETDQKEPDTQMETNDVNNVNQTTSPQNYTAQELQVDEVSTTKEELSPEIQDVPYFRRLLVTETERLNDLCLKWEDISTSTNGMSEDVSGQLRTVVGQAQLLMAQRFKQFEGLVDNCEFNRGEKETTCTDLQGFWEMIYYQVEDVNLKFKDLEKLQANNWDISSIQPKKPVLKKKVTAKPVVKKPAVKSKFAAFRAGMKANTSKTSEDKTFDFGFFKVQSPVKNPSPHCAAGSPKQLPKVEISSENRSDEKDQNESEEDSLKVQDTNTDKLSPLPETEKGLLTPKMTPLRKRSYVPNIPSPLLQDITPQPRLTRSSTMVRKTPLPPNIMTDVDDDVIMNKNLTNLAKDLVVTLSAKKSVNKESMASPTAETGSDRKPRRRSLRTRKSVSFCDNVVVPTEEEKPTEDQDPFSKYLQPMTPRMSMAPKGYSVLDAIPDDDSFSVQAEAGSDLTFSPANNSSQPETSPLSRSATRHSGLKKLPTRERRRSARKSVQFTSPKSDTSRSLSNISTPESSDSSDNDTSRFPSLNIGFTPVARSARPSLLFTPPSQQDQSLSTTSEVPTAQLISFTP